MSDVHDSIDHQNPRRWRLHRSGVIDVWVYGVLELDLSGGRLILQGANGSGKSRTLEFQLPLCLDGDLRYMGTKGHDSVIMSRLMLDDYPGGPVRIGYCWHELQRVRDGHEEFLTCGIGVKASKSTRDITDSWRFITARRVGFDFELVTPDRAPVDLPQLKALIGEDAICEKVDEFRRRVAPAVYGIADTHRYEDLLHLQRTLRNPDIGVRAATGHLEECLSLALPPLDNEIITRLAGQLQDLEAIGDNIKRLRQADEILVGFMEIYQRYARGVLKKRAGALETAREELATHLLAAEKHRAKSVTLDKKEQQYAEEIDDLESKKTSLEKQIRDAQGTAQFQGLSQIDRRREAVGAHHAAVGKAVAAAQRSRETEERTCAAAVARLGEVQRAAASAREIARDASEKMRAIGLDPQLVPTLPAMAEPTPVEQYESVLQSDSSDAVPQPLRQIMPPEIDVDEAVRLAQAISIQADRATESVGRQRMTIDRLIAEGRELDTQFKEIVELKYKADEAAAAESVARGKRDTARTVLSDQSALWSEAQNAWANAIPATSVPLGTAPTRTQPVTVADSAVAEVLKVKRQLQAWAKPAVDTAREEIRQATSRIEALSAERKLLADERQALVNGAEIAPPEPSVPRDSRSGRNGSAFYRLVDYQPDLSDEDRAGLEGALQASGLLDAWIYPNGTLDDPRLAELVAVTPAHTAGHVSRTDGTLAAVLTPNQHTDTRVPPPVVERLLAAVRLDSKAQADGSDGLTISTTGRWRNGNLVGYWPKPIAEYIGAPTREATRGRRIADLDEGLGSVTAVLRDTRDQLRGSDEALRLWEKHLENAPEPSELFLAHAVAVSAEESHRESALEAKRKITLYDEASARWTARHDVIKRQAADANLPYETDELASTAMAAVQTSEACRNLMRSQDAVLAALRQVPPSITDFNTARRDREAAERDAATEHRAYVDNLAVLNGLIDSLSLEDADFEERLTRLRGSLEATERRIPLARADKEEAGKKLAQVEALLSSDDQAEADKAAVVTSAGRELTAAASAPGLWMAATGTDFPVNLGLDDLLAQARLLPEHATDPDAVINGLRQLDSGLPSGQQARLSSVDNVHIVHILEVDGWQSVAAGTISVRQRLRKDEETLDERYSKIFEDYLLRDLSEHLRRQIDAATALCRRMNAILAEAETSQGVRVQLAWEPAPTIDADTHEALNLVRKTFAVRQPDEDERLRRALQERIEAERERHRGQYADVLARALDYRTWYGFSVKVQDNDEEGKTRNRRFKNLSAGETRFVAYIVMIAAAAAFYDALTEPGTDPLRVVLLDEAFERLDDPTITRLLELLAALDMDWIITWPGGSAFSDKIERMHVYDVLRRKGSRSIALAHTTWDGRQARRQS